MNIPKDWVEESIDKIAKVIRGASPRPIENPIWFEKHSKIGWIRIADISKAKKYLYQTSQKLSKLGIVNSRRVNYDDLIMSICATVGKPIILKIDACIHDGFVVFKDLNIYRDFLYYILQDLEPKWSLLGQVGSQLNLNTNLIRLQKLIIPSNTKEQKAIAEVLSDIDSLIESTEKLIEKKKLIKKGTMQNLLTGKVRLPGFGGKWIEENLGNVSEIKTGKKNNEDKKEHGKYPFFVRSQNVERINTYSFDGEAIIIPGEGNIGEIIHYINGRFDYHQRVYKISDFKNNDGKFIYYYLKLLFGFHALKNTVKATVDSIRLDVFTKFSIIVPKDIKEQTAIANILSDMDNEIQTLENKLTKYQEIKQGAMQQLLSGKIRL